MRSNKYVKLSIPLNLKEKVTMEAGNKGMNTSSFVRFKLFEAIVNNDVMDSIPTMKCNVYLKFRAPVELMNHVEQQAITSNVTVSAYIRSLLFNAVIGKEIESRYPQNYAQGRAGFYPQQKTIPD